MADTGGDITAVLEGTKVVGPQLVRLLRNRIVRGELAPGMRLSEAEVATAYGVSRQPVREAFIRLADASLIEVRPQRGSYVSRIDIPTVISAQFVRESVEADIVRQAVVRATSADVAALEDMLGAQVEAAKVTDPQPFMATDEAFHRRLALIAGQGEVWDFLQPLKTQMDRVRYLSARSFPRLILVGQHSNIVDAIRQGDAVAGERVMRHHLGLILEDLPAVVAAMPDFFKRGG